MLGIPRYLLELAYKPNNYLSEMQKETKKLHLPSFREEEIRRFSTYAKSSDDPEIREGAGIVLKRLGEITDGRFEDLCKNGGLEILYNTKIRFIPAGDEIAGYQA